MIYRAIALDLDGTLTNSNKIITPKTKEALMEIQKRGCRVILASGRPTPGVTFLAKELELHKYGGFILSYNGGMIYDCGRGREIYKRSLPADVIGKLYEKALEYQVGILTYDSEGIVAGTPADEYMEKEKICCNLSLKYVEDFPGYVTFNVCKCLMTAEPSHMAEVEKKMQKDFFGVLECYRSEPYFLEVVPKNIDKGRSLQKLLTSIGLSSDEVICCGDGFNDLSMLKVSGLGVAMGNAQPEIKEIADYVTLSNDEDGIAHVIAEFML
ncbi:MAG: HAD family phosphatase [Clostridia bacterium]|nr:HAD family phosphatase [Clostridia bacterium]NCC44345.1 HAD family phosphatase [Clostridia bacterium]